jgi:hypothetical protein
MARRTIGYAMHGLQEMVFKQYPIRRTRGRSCRPPKISPIDNDEQTVGIYDLTRDRLQSIACESYALMPAQHVYRIPYAT